MNSIKILFSAVFIFLVLGVFSAINAQEIVLTPETSNINLNSTIDVEIHVQNPAGTNTFQVDLLVPTGLTVTFFELESNPDFINAIGCAGGGTDFYNAAEVCFSLEDTNNFSEDDLIATFTLQGDEANILEITFGTDSLLSDTTNDFPQTGIAGTYTVIGAGSTPTPTPLPDTAIDTSDARLSIILYAGAFITLGLAILLATFKVKRLQLVTEG